jgi:Pregnancy-associated plasma protein-A
MKKILVFFLVLTSFPVFLTAQAWLPTKKIIRRDAPVVQEPLERLSKRLLIPQRRADDFVPDTAHLEHTPVKWVRINLHFVNSSSKKHNYDGAEAIQFARDLVGAANGDLQRNNQLWLPWKNQIPVIPPRYAYVLWSQKNMPNDQGVYFHYDDELCFYVHKGGNANLYDRRVMAKYGVGTDSIVNIFIMPHHPDSMLSPDYKRSTGGVGVMLSEGIKMAGMFESKMPAWAYRGILNHEVGHFFGLFHAFDSDGCDDTPEHGNPCWNRTAEPPCNTQASNNMMDYNALQNALTPCQIGRVLMLMNDTSAYERRYLIQDWCSLKTEDEVLVSDTLIWRGDRDLKSNLRIVKGGFLQVEGRVSLPENALITLEPGSTLLLRKGHLHNACNRKWQGIAAPRKFLGRRGQLILEGEARVEDAKNWSVETGR